MAQNITIAGASYSDVPSIIVPKTSSGTALFVDTSDTTATADKILSGYGAYDADGNWMDGTASSGGGSSMASGTVTPSSASTSLTFDTGLSTINGILVMPVDSPYTGTRTQIGMIIIPSGSYFQSFSFYTNNGGTGNVTPTGYTNQTRLTQSGTTVTITGNYNWRTITYQWFAW